MNRETEKGIVMGETDVSQPESTITEVKGIVCRLCAHTSDPFIAIYGEEGMSHQLSYKMNLYLPIKVSETDTLPLQCCWNCTSTILAWHELAVLSVETDYKLRSLFNIEVNKQENNQAFETYGEPPSPLVEEQEAEGLELKTPAASLNVFYQDVSFETNQQKQPPILKTKQSPNNKKQELVFIGDESWVKYVENDQNQLIETSDPCDTIIKFNKLDDAYTTLQIATSPHNVSGNVEIHSSELSLQTEHKIEAAVVANSDENKTAVINNVKSSLEKREDDPNTMHNFSCYFCASLFVNEEDILNHVKIEHSDKHLDENPLSTNPVSKKKKFRCRKLDQSMINSAKVVINGRIYYSCKVCEKILHSPYTYIWHVRIHTGERPYICDLCGKQFRISQGLVRHVKETHQGVKNFACDICGRMFATRRNVQEHRRIHTNERPYMCDLCGKNFKQKASLFVHNRSHSTSYPFSCSYCQQRFRTRPPLLIHITRHTGEKPYACDECGRFFRIKYELKRHKLKHSEEKPFSCGQCGLMFKQKRYLKNHIKTNHKQLV